MCARPFKTREEGRIVTALKSEHLDRGQKTSIDLDTHTHTFGAGQDRAGQDTSLLALYEEGA